MVTRCPSRASRRRAPGGGQPTARSSIRSAGRRHRASRSRTCPGSVGPISRAGNGSLPELRQRRETMRFNSARPPLRLDRPGDRRGVPSPRRRWPRPGRTSSTGNLQPPEPISGSSTSAATWRTSTFWTEGHSRASISAAACSTPGRLTWHVHGDVPRHLEGRLGGEDRERNECPGDSRRNLQALVRRQLVRGSRADPRTEARSSSMAMAPFTWITPTSTSWAVRSHSPTR